MTTITFQLPPALMERAQKVAGERELDLDALALEAFLEYLEEQEDIAYAKERLALIRSGTVKTISLEEMEKRLFGNEEA
jgi:predicted DNA-binding protein